MLFPISSRMLSILCFLFQLWQMAYKGQTAPWVNGNEEWSGDLLGREDFVFLPTSLIQGKLVPMQNIFQGFWWYVNRVVFFFPLSVVFASCFPWAALIAGSCIMPCESGVSVPDLLLEDNHSLNVDLEDSVFHKPTPPVLAWSWREGWGKAVLSYKIKTTHNYYQLFPLRHQYGSLSFC